MNEHARVSFRYDGMGLPVEERCDEHLIKRSYDKHGLIRSLQSSLGVQLSYERNEYGELICFKANEAETNARFTSEHQYDSLGFELEHLLPEALVRVLPMTTSDVWSIARLAVLRSSAAPATTPNPLVLPIPPKGHSILRKRLKPKSKNPLSYKEEKGLLPLECGVDCNHYQLSSNDTPVGNVSRGTSTQRREQVL